MTKTPYGPVRFEARAGGTQFWGTWVAPMAVGVLLVPAALLVFRNPDSWATIALVTALTAAVCGGILGVIWRRTRQSWVQVTDTHLLLHTPEAGFTPIAREDLAAAVVPRSWDIPGVSGEHVFFLGHDGRCLGRIIGQQGNGAGSGSLWGPDLLRQVAAVAPVVVEPERLTAREARERWPGMLPTSWENPGKSILLGCGIALVITLGIVGAVAAIMAITGGS